MLPSGNGNGGANGNGNLNGNRKSGGNGKTNGKKEEMVRIEKRMPDRKELSLW